MKILIFFAVLFALKGLAENCGGNCPGNKCPSCPCGRSPNRQDPSFWCAKYSKWDQSCCRCIVNHESGGNANAMNYNTNGSFDVGLFQINKVNWSACSGGNAPCDVNTNLNCAIKVWNWAGGNFNFWSTARGCGCRKLMLDNFFQADVTPVDQ